MPRTTVCHFDNGRLKATVRVTSPDLTPEEYKKRWAEVERTASRFVNECLRDGIITMDYFKQAENI